MPKLLWLGIAGGLGALARYGLSTVVQRTSGAVFPWGTLVVNVLGAFVFGLIWSLVENRLVMSVEMRVILLTGFLGGFTTFSSFMFETAALMTDGQWGLAALNLGGQVMAGLVAVFLGLAIGRAI